MNPGLIDHVIAFILIVIAPITSIRTYRSMCARVRANPERRRREYQWMIANQWSFVAIVLGAWFAVGRDRAAIGLVLPFGIRSLIGLAITAAVLGVLCFQTISVRRGGEAARASVRSQLGPIDVLIPRTAADMRWFGALAVTAGFCEEVLYRGFLIAYLGAFIGTWPAVVAGAAMFGIAHLYQSRANAMKAAVGALLAGAFYVGCGSLLWPMILHAALNLNSGSLARMALTDSHVDQ